VTFSDVIAVIALAMLQGALVALPRADALERLGRLRSPAWAAVLPGMIIVGALGLLALPSMAPVILLASVATPLQAGVAVVLVARGQRAAVLPVAVAVAAAVGSGWFGQLSASTLTALGCLPLGAALARLPQTHLTGHSGWENAPRDAMHCDQSVRTSRRGVASRGAI
jgi:hypothetical protein